MWALRIVIDFWIAEGHISSTFYYPATFEKAQNIQQAAKMPLPAPSSANSITAAPAEDFLEADWAMLQAIGGGNTVLGGVVDEDVPAAGANDIDNGSVSSDGSYAGVGVARGNNCSDYPSPGPRIQVPTASVVRGGKCTV
ncbi:hypothetical protein F5051DRAFT_433583 [Lentinula edodes]|nr:hypothetical protein F5051DRAFT_433583 [Lentinula edodes]